jgi:hypothetical protein
MAFLEVDAIKSCTSTGIGSPKLSARTTGTWTSASWSGPTRAGSQIDLSYDHRTNRRALFVDALRMPVV